MDGQGVPVATDVTRDRATRSSRISLMTLLVCSFGGKIAGIDDPAAQRRFRARIIA